MKIFKYFLFTFLIVMATLSCKEEEQQTPTDVKELGAVLSFINPTRGTVGDSVTIYGKNFSLVKEENQLSIGGIPMEIVELSAGKIITTIPKSAKSDIIILKTKEKMLQSENFTVVNKTPLITSIEPATVKPGEIITIKGEDFGEEENSIQVFMGSSLGAITSFSKNEIKVKVPNVAYDVLVKVNSNGAVSNLVSYPVIPIPLISSLTPAIACPGMTVGISGSRFDEEFNLKVGFNNSFLPINSIGSGPNGPYLLNVKIPENAVSDSIHVTASTGTGKGAFLTIIAKPTVVSSSITSGSIGDEVTLNGSGFTNFGTEPVQVYFGYKIAEIISITNSAIKVKVPADAQTSELKVVIHEFTMSAGTFTIN